MTEADINQIGQREILTAIVDDDGISGAVGDELGKGFVVIEAESGGRRIEVTSQFRYWLPPGLKVTICHRVVGVDSLTNQLVYGGYEVCGYLHEKHEGAADADAISTR